MVWRHNIPLEQPTAVQLKTILNHKNSHRHHHRRHGFGINEFATMA
jgi:hypothetical protein